METTVRHTRHEAANWWVYLLGGGLLIFLGMRAFQYPIAAYLGLSMWFAAAILMNGLANIFFAFTNQVGFGSWLWKVALGLIEAGLGLYLLAMPGLAMETLDVFIGWWLLFRSIVISSSAFTLREAGDSYWGWVLAAGILAGVLAVLALANPMMGADGVTIWVGMSLVVVGGAACLLAFRLR